MSDMIADMATGCRERVVAGGQFYDGSGEKISDTAARRLCARLGPGWEPRVWQNDGWCFEAHYKGLIHVHPSSLGKWFCMIGVGGMLCSLAPRGIPSQADPAKAVRLTVAGYRRKWEAFKAEQEELIKAGEECLKGGL